MPKSGELRRPGYEIRLLIDDTDLFALEKPTRLIKLVSGRGFNASLVRGDRIPSAALARPGRR